MSDDSLKTHSQFFSCVSISNGDIEYNYCISPFPVVIFVGVGANGIYDYLEQLHWKTN